MVSNDLSVVESIWPRYRSTAANAEIELATASAEVITYAGTYHGEGTAFLRLAPHDRVVLSVTLSDEDGWHVSGVQDFRLRFGSGVAATPILLLRQTHSNDGWNLEFTPSKGPIILGANKRVRLKRVIFHILNFPKLLSLGCSSGRYIHSDEAGERLLGRLFLSHDKWDIELQELPETHRLIGQLKEDGGHAITLVGCLSRRDRRDFAVCTAERVISDLHHFLSFARGSWTGIFGNVGVDKSEKTVYENLGLRLSTPWGFHFSWFDENYGQTLSEAYVGFVDLLHNADLGDAVSSALYWYLRSNRAGEGAGIDSGILLSQAALERLAFATLTKNGLSTKGSAADQLRRMLQHLDVPTALPKTSTRLRSAKRRGLWIDGPDAIRKVRNELTHPKKRLPTKIRPLVFEAWQLSQWYIEMTILRMGGYSGSYSNRLTARYVGEVEPVPWLS